MSARIEDWAWQQRVGSSLRKMIFARLASTADESGWSYWGQANIARVCETSRQTVNEHVAKLRGMGLVQVVPTRRADGRQGTNLYRVMAPWLDPNAPPPRRRRAASVVVPDSGRVGEDDSRNPQQAETSDERRGPPIETERPTWLGQRRWRVVSSREGKGPYVVDLARGTCPCEARTGACRHLEAARVAEREALTAQRQEFRNAVWDALVEVYGPPPTREESERGGSVAALGELLVASGVPREALEWQAEIRRRYRALAEAWGVDKTTLRAFVRNWHIAGKLADGETNVRLDGDNGSDDGIFSGYTRD